MDKYLLSYLAGFIDGEGCITTSGKTGFRVCVSNTNYTSLKLLQETFGGNINDQFIPVNPKWNCAWKWSICSRPKLHEFLKIIHPYLRIKKAEALAVLEHLDKYQHRKRWSKPSDTEVADFLLVKALVKKLK